MAKFKEEKKQSSFMSLLNQIQMELLDDSISTSSILRKAYVLARQVGDSNFLNWVQNELNGYDWNKIRDVKDFLRYRRPGGYLQGVGPYNITKPVEISNPEIYDKVCHPPIVMSIPEIEAQILDTPPSESVRMTISPDTAAILCKAIGMDLHLFLLYSKASFQGIVETVRNRLLQIVMDIKEKIPDIAQRKPTHAEKAKLAKTIIQIINNPQGCQIAVEQSLNYSFEEFKGIVVGILAQQSIPKENIDKLIKVLEETSRESPPKKSKKLPEKITNFIKQNKTWLIPTVISMIRKFWLGT